MRGCPCAPLPTCQADRDMQCGFEVLSRTSFAATKRTFATILQDDRSKSRLHSPRNIALHYSSLLSLVSDRYRYHYLVKWLTPTNHNLQSFTVAACSM